ncbi:MAG: TerB N-terminal domain-containing protein [Rhodospirillales bacterium]|nr:TerB N-terminal domain-containing protein [Rhodospirillales bacterium]
MNPTLSVSDPRGLAPSVSYYPSYSALEPHARDGYLQWLAAGRSSPDANIGHVFLYFYGRERRLPYSQMALRWSKAAALAAREALGIA